MADLEVDVAIVGAGPAGLGAAIALRRAEVGRVLVLERENEAGGIPRHCGHPPFGLREFGRLLTGPAYARRLAAAAAAAGVELALRHSVVALLAQGGLEVASPDGTLRVSARRVILATGVREASRAQRLIGGDRPLGVMTTGALQSFVYGEGRLPFRSPVIAGTELVSFSALLTLRGAGARPVAMIEAGPRIVARAACGLYPRLVGVPVLVGTEIVEIRGGKRVESVTLRSAAGTVTSLACDGVLLSGEFSPAAELGRAAGLGIDRGTRGPAVDQFGRTSDPLVFAAGNVLHPVETAGWCWREGRRIGAAVAFDLESGLPSPEGAMQIEAKRGLAYAVPQRVVPGAAQPALPSLQARAAAVASGQLTATQAGALLWRRSATLRPERRLLLPLPSPSGRGGLQLNLEPP